MHRDTYRDVYAHRVCLYVDLNAHRRIDVGRRIRIYVSLSIDTLYIIHIPRSIQCLQMMIMTKIIEAKSNMGPQEKFLSNR